MDKALSEIIENAESAGSTNSTLVVMPAVVGDLVILEVVEFAPAAIFRGGYPSGARHPRGWWQGSIFEFIDSGFPPYRLRVKGLLPAEVGSTEEGSGRTEEQTGVTEEETGVTGSGPLLTVPFLLFADRRGS